MINTVITSAGIAHRFIMSDVTLEKHKFHASNILVCRRKDANL